MKTKTIELLLPELDKLLASRETTEAMKPRLETEIAEMLAGGDLDEKLAASLQTKRAQLELIPAKLAQLDKRIEGVKAEIEADFQPRYVAFERKCSGILARERCEIAKSVAPFIIPENADANIVADRAIDLLLDISLAAHSVAAAKNNVAFPLSQRNVVQAARNIIEPEYMIEKISIRRESAA